MDIFRSEMLKKGLKITQQRLAGLDEMAKDNGHRESEEIYLTIKNNQLDIARATVYRTLDILVKSNFVRKLDLGDGRARYENKIDSQHHDHIICDCCGKIIEFVDLKIERLQDEVANKYQFLLKRHTHQLFGICKECQ